MAKRAHGQGTVYRRKDGRWHAQVMIDGQRLDAYSSRSQREALKALDEKKRKLSVGLPVTDERLSTGKYLADWLEGDGKRNVQHSTWRSYRHYADSYIIPALGKKRLNRLTRDDVQQLFDKFSDDGMAPRTAWHIRAVLRKALNDAIRRGHLAQNVATMIEMPKVTRFEVAAWTPDQIRQFLAASEEHRLHALFLVTYVLGLRKGEVMALGWKDVDLDEGAVTIRVAVKRGPSGHEIGSPKSESSRRSLLLPPLALPKLREHRARQGREQLMHGDKWHDAGLVFTTPIGTRLDDRNLSRVFHRIREEAKLPQTRFHDLRHLYASHLLAEGVPLHVVKELLGHAAITTTVDTYGHVLPAARQAAAEVMDRILQGSV